MTTANEGPLVTVDGLRVLEKKPLFFILSSAVPYKRSAGDMIECHRSHDYSLSLSAVVSGYLADLASSSVVVIRGAAAHAMRLYCALLIHAKRVACRNTRATEHTRTQSHI